MSPIIYRYLLYPLRQAFRKTFRPKTRGVKTIVLCKNEILLIKNTYGDMLWTLPGGGIKKKENLAEAARREVKEEVGIKLRDVKKIGVFVDKKDTKHIFVSRVENKNHKIDKKEVKTAEWFDIHKIPSSNMQSQTLIESLKLLKK